MTRAAVSQIASKDPNLIPIVRRQSCAAYLAFSKPKECEGGRGGKAERRQQQDEEKKGVSPGERIGARVRWQSRRRSAVRGGDHVGRPRLSTCAPGRAAI